MNNFIEFSEVHANDVSEGTLKLWTKPKTMKIWKVLLKYSFVLIASVDENV